jgi:hypothetical protein
MGSLPLTKGLNMPICVKCQKEITKENDSEEHVLPNAIGGRKKIMGFLHKNCNNETGDMWDTELANRCNILSSMFFIKRDRNKTPPEKIITLSGKSYWLRNDGSLTLCKPEYETYKKDGKTHVQIKARDPKEARQQLKRVKKEYPNVDIDTLLESVKSDFSYLSEPVEFNLDICGHGCGRELVKSALAMVVDAGVSFEKCEHANDYLWNNGPACFGYYAMPKDIVLNRPVGMPLHTVYVKGISESKQILGYVELFGVHRIVVNLSSSYVGEDFENSYSVNPMTGESLVLSFDLSFSEEELMDCFDYKMISQEVRCNALRNPLMI